MFTPLPYEEREARRGMLTEEAKKIYFDFNGEELTVRILRFMPFLNNALLNDHKIDPKHINKEEVKILSGFNKAGYIKRNLDSQTGKIIIEITDYKFYKMMTDLLFVSYVNVAY